MISTAVCSITYTVISLATIALLISSLVKKDWWTIDYDGQFGYKSTVTIGLWKACIQEVWFPEDCRDYIRDSPNFSDKVKDIDVIRTFLFVALVSLSLSTLAMLLLTCKRSRGFITRHIIWTKVLTWIAFISLLIVIGFSTIDQANPSRPVWMALPWFANKAKRNYEEAFILLCVATGLAFLLIIVLIGHLVIVLKRSKSKYIGGGSRYVTPRHLEMSSRDYLDKKYEGGVYKSDVNANIGKLNASLHERNIGNTSTSDYYSGIANEEMTYVNENVINEDYEFVTLASNNDVFDSPLKSNDTPVENATEGKQEFIQIRPSISSQTSRLSESSLTTFPTNKNEVDGKNAIIRCNSVPVKSEPRILPILHLSELRKQLAFRQEEDEESSIADE